ncbi:MAG: amidohydrolase family protein [Bacillota bacterium]
MLAVVNAVLHPMEGEIIDGATILIDAGRVVEVGTEGVEVPAGSQIIDASGRIVTPGLVDAHSHVGLVESGVGWEGSDADESSDPVTAWARALDGFNPGDSALAEMRASGVTCVNVLPGSANVIGGAGVAVKCAGCVADQMVVKSPTCIKAVLGEVPKQVHGGKGRAPSTRMASAAALREALQGARRHLEKCEGAEDPPRDRNAGALAPVLRGEIPLVIECHRADDIVTAIRICREFGMDPVLDYATEAHRVMELLQDSGAHLAAGPMISSGIRPEERERSPQTPARLAVAGVPFCLMTDHPGTNGRYLAAGAGIAAGWGLDWQTALESITIRAAEHIGVQSRVGSISAGKDGDLVIWSGDPLEATTFADVAIIEGEVVYRREAM